jgi:hypothetical protein
MGSHGAGAEKAAVSAQHLFMYAAENSGSAYDRLRCFMPLSLGLYQVYVGDSASLKRLVLQALSSTRPTLKVQPVEHLRYLAGNKRFTPLMKLTWLGAKTPHLLMLCTGSWRSQPGK